MATAVLTKTTIFQPIQFSNCCLWLDSRDIGVFYTDSSLTTSVSIGSSIGCWVDKSPEKNNAIQNNTIPINQQPILLKNAVQFNKINTTVLSLPNNTIPSGNSPYSIYIILTPNSSGPDIVLSSGSPGQANILSYSSGTFINTDLSGGTEIQGTKTLIELIYISDVNRTIYQNGNIIITSSTNSLNTGSSYNYIGAGVLQGLYSSCLIHEVIIFRDASSEDIRQKIEGYLTWKWALQKYLPLIHPYYNNTIYDRINNVNYTNKIIN